MNRTQGWLIVLGGVLLAAVGDLLWLYPHLPAQIATKFNAAGTAIEWSAKEGFLAFHVCLLCLLIGMALAGRYLVPLIPPHLVNVPRRDYWLAPERQAFTRRRIGELVLGICTTNLAFVTVLTHLTLRANLATPPMLGREQFYLVGGLFVVFAILIVPEVLFFRKLR
jgi:uncharacterized membrane protein